MSLLARRRHRAPARPHIAQVALADREAAQARQAEREAARNFEAGVRAADAETARALAVQVTDAARCDLTAADVLPVCELVVAARREAASRGLYLAEPSMDDLLGTCEDLATRNARRGYGAFVPAMLVCEAVFGGGAGLSAVNMHIFDDFKAIGARLPEGHSGRLGALQHPGDERARLMLSQLADADIRYQS